MNTVDIKSIRLGRMAPTIPVTNIHAAVEFYSNVLGLEKVFENGNPVGFAILKKESAELHLTLCKEHQPTRHNVAHLLVSDATLLYEICVKERVRIIKGLRDAKYDMRGFVFEDPDGNRIDVGQPIVAKNP